MSFPQGQPGSDLQVNSIDGNVLGTFDSGARQIHQAPSRFNLPADVVHTACPTGGASAPVTVLPHIVLKGADVPWSRSPTNTLHETEGQVNDEQDPAPWFVLLAFSPDELRLEEDELDDILQRIPSIKKRQGETFSVRIPARYTPQLSNALNTISFDTELDAHSADESLDVIFLKNDLFQCIFTVADAVTGASRLDLIQYKSMTHVRRVPTSGIDDSEALSVSISPRTGPIGLKHPETVVVHLVSLDMGPDLTLVSESKRVAVTSLHSWTYTCLPDGQDTRVSQCVSHFGQSLAVLPPEPQDIPISSDIDPKVKAFMRKRLEDGYSLVRHRTVTGEQTTAIVRGPLIPKPVAHPLSEHFCTQSNFGTNLNIVDEDVGLTNITYSSAWTLGRSMASNDQQFIAALVKLRSAVRAGGPGRSKIDLQDSIGGIDPGKRTILGRDDLLKEFGALTQHLDGHVDGGPAVSSSRWRKGREPDATKSTPFTESTIYDDAAFKHVYAWVLDKLHLKQVPWHYICLDESWLPPETLRFVYVDENWTDALVDGALSLANLPDGSSKGDSSRTAIKKAINSKVSLPDKALGGRVPSTPVYGFVLRSQLLVQFPDIIVTPVFAATPSKQGADNVLGASKPVILSQQRISVDSICCLFNSFPAKLERLVFTVPPHQQRFVIGESIMEEKLTVKARPLYTQWDKEKRQDTSRASDKTVLLPLADGSAFDLGSRMIKVQNYADLVREALQQTGAVEGVSSPWEANGSALMALHLSETIPELVIRAPETSEDIPKPAEDRLYGRQSFRLSLPKGS